MSSNSMFKQRISDFDNRVERIELTEKNPAQKLNKLNLNKSVNYVWVIDYNLTKSEMFFFVKFLFQKIESSLKRKHAIIYTKPELYNQQLTIYGLLTCKGIKAKIFNNFENACFWINK